MEQKQSIAVEIALQTQVLRTCPIHHEIFCDDEVDPSVAFALAVDLVRQHKPYVRGFHDDHHELTDLLSEIIGAAPNCCPHCPNAPQNRSPDRQGGEAQPNLSTPFRSLSAQRLSPQAGDAPV